MGGKSLSIEEVKTKLPKGYKVRSWQCNSKPASFFCKEHELDYTVSRGGSALCSSVASCPKCTEEIRLQKFAATKRSNYLDRHLSDIKRRFKGNLTLVSEYKGDRVLHTYRCLKHGDFKQKPCYVKDNKFPCPKCGFEHVGSKSRDGFRAVFMDRVRQSKFEYISGYVDAYTWCTLTCPDHGDFKTKPTLFSPDRPKCPGCVAEWKKSGAGQRFSNREFRQMVRENSPDIRILSTYAGAKTKVEFKCKKGHTWKADPYTVQYGLTGCPTCARENMPHVSAAENEIAEWLRKKYPDLIQSSRSIVKGHEIDIYIPSLKLGIEYNGLYWHSSKVRPTDYHKVKREAAEANGLRLIFVWEDDWIHRQSVVKKTLRHVVGASTRYYARKLELRTTEDIAKVRQFYDVNHLQGSPQSGITYGLFDGKTCVAAMTFSRIVSVRGVKQQEGHYELVRYATTGSIVGGASRLFTAFVRDRNPIKVLSYSDCDWFDGSMYSMLGFGHVGNVAPDYTVVFPNTVKRAHKSKARRSALAVKLGDKFDAALSERENCEANNILRCYNSGKKKWEWRSK